MKILKYGATIILFSLSLFSFGCSKNNDQKSINVLINDVLDKSCNENIRQSMENEINWQRQHLTEQQMRRSLQNMLNNMQC